MIRFEGKVKVEVSERRRGREETARGREGKGRGRKSCGETLRRERGREKESQLCR